MDSDDDSNCNSLPDEYESDSDDDYEADVCPTVVGGHELHCVLSFEFVISLFRFVSLHYFIHYQGHRRTA